MELALLPRLVSNLSDPPTLASQYTGITGHFGSPRQEDHLRSGVRDQPGQDSQTLSLLKIQKLAECDESCSVTQAGVRWRSWLTATSASQVQFWDYRCEPPCLAFKFLFFVLKILENETEFETNLGNMTKSPKLDGHGDITCGPSYHFGRPRWVDHKVRCSRQPDQHGKTPSLLKIEKLAKCGEEKFKVETRTIAVDFASEDIYDKIKTGLAGLEIGVLDQEIPGRSSPTGRQCGCLASAAALPAPRRGGSPHKIHWSVCPFNW
ncbi:Very-long-chain 3-oxoacyl-CoA reductase [Plecturocebus cupreus]